MKAKTFRISAGTRVIRHHVLDHYEVQEICPQLEAKKKDIQDYYDGKYKKQILCEERLKL